MSNIFKFEQGDVLRDKITGFEGTVTARTDFYNGCIQYYLEAKSVDGKKPETTWVDEQQAEVVSSEARHEAQARTGGGHRPRA